MSAHQHKACCGTMFHETLHFSENTPMRGKVFSFELDRAGLPQSGRSIEADTSEWDDCLECEEFQHCDKLCMANLLLQTAIERQ